MRIKTCHNQYNYHDLLTASEKKYKHSHEGNTEKIEVGGSLLSHQLNIVVAFQSLANGYHVSSTIALSERYGVD
jgi:hypothetical protein